MNKILVINIVNIIFMIIVNIVFHLVINNIHIKHKIQEYNVYNHVINYLITNIYKIMYVYHHVKEIILSQFQDIFVIIIVHIILIILKNIMYLIVIMINIIL